MEVEKLPALRAETQEKVVAFQENEYGDLVELNRAFESVTFNVRLDLQYIAEPYIDANVLPYYLSSIKRITYGYSQSES